MVKVIEYPEVSSNMETESVHGLDEPGRNTKHILESIRELGDDNGIEFFERNIGSKDNLNEFVASIRKHRKQIVSSQRTSEPNREFISEKFGEFLDNDDKSLGISAWNDWRDHVSFCIDKYGRGVSYIATKEEIILLGPGFAETVVGVGLSSVKNLERDIKMGQDPPQFDFSGRQLDYHYYLPGVDFSYANFTDTSFNRLDLSWAKLFHSTFIFSDFRGSENVKTVLEHADMHNGLIICAKMNDVKFKITDFTNSLILGTNFIGLQMPESIFKDVMMPGIILRGSSLQGSNFAGAYMRFGDLRNTDLRGSVLNRVDLRDADISGSKVWGTGGWGKSLKNLIQNDLILTEDGSPGLTCDSLKLAQDIYEVHEDNGKLGEIINAWKGVEVPIFGIFHGDHKGTLERIKKELREKGKKYVPVIYDFKIPQNQPYITETSTTIARLSRFIIFDITDIDRNDVKWTKEEFIETVLGVRSAVIVPIIRKGVPVWKAFTTLKDRRRYESEILDPVVYEDADDLIRRLQKDVIEPAEARVKGKRETHLI